MKEELPDDEITEKFNKFEFLRFDEITDRNTMHYFDVLGMKSSRREVFVGEVIKVCV